MARSSLWIHYSFLTYFCVTQLFPFWSTGFLICYWSIHLSTLVVTSKFWSTHLSILFEPHIDLGRPMYPPWLFHPSNVVDSCIDPCRIKIWPWSTHVSTLVDSSTDPGQPCRYAPFLIFDFYWIMCFFSSLVDSGRLLFRLWYIFYRFCSTPLTIMLESSYQSWLIPISTMIDSCTTLGDSSTDPIHACPCSSFLIYDFKRIKRFIVFFCWLRSALILRLVDSSIDHGRHT